MLQKNVFYASGLKRFYFVLAGRAFFLLTAKETKLPARNFFIQVSSWARSVPSQKIDHAGLRAERGNGGLALLGSDNDHHSCYKSKYRPKISAGATNKICGDNLNLLF